jgi:hypothetical protein
MANNISGNELANARRFDSDLLLRTRRTLR